MQWYKRPRHRNINASFLIKSQARMCPALRKDDMYNQSDFIGMLGLP